MNKHWNRLGDVAQGVIHVKDVTFEKTGAEIQRSIDTKVATLTTAIVKSEATIAEICKRREVEVSEVLGVDAQETEQKIGTYSAAVGERLQAKTALDRLNADMHALRHEAWGIEGARNEIDSLTRVKRNIQPERKFDLGYGELVRFGF